VMAGASATFDPHRFRSTVPFYARFRLAYPDRLIERVGELAGIRPGDALLDLGAGPGQIGIAFAQRGLRVTAVDPEPEMLHVAGEAGREAGVALDLRQGSSFALPAGIGPFKLVTIGRAFHWMDREETLRNLDPLIVADGAVALFGENHPKTVENAFQRKLSEISERYSGRSSHDVARSAADYRSDESMLMNSPFRRLERCGVLVRRTTTIEEVIGLAFSRSSSSPAKLGERATDFERELREELSAISPDGRFTEIAELKALVARRD
jgi:SAM-dependent methyltransferase